MRPSPSLSMLSVQIRPPISGSTGWQFRSSAQASSWQSVRPSWSLSTVSKQRTPSSVTGPSVQSGLSKQSVSSQSIAPSPSSSKPLSQASTIEMTPPSVPSAVVSTPPSGSGPPSAEPSKASPVPVLPEPSAPVSEVPPPTASPRGEEEVPQAARRRSRNGAASVLADMGPLAKGASKGSGQHRTLRHPASPFRFARVGALCASASRPRRRSASTRVTAKPLTSHLNYLP